MQIDVFCWYNNININNYNQYNNEVIVVANYKVKTETNASFQSLRPCEFANEVNLDN